MRVAGFMQSDVVPNSLPRYTAWVVVTALLDWDHWTEWRLLVGRGHAEVTENGATAALDDHNWAEWRHRVGQAVVEITRSEIQMPSWLRDTQDRALAEVSRRVDEAGFFIREGILTHDRGVMDTFRL